MKKHTIIISTIYLFLGTTMLAVVIESSFEYFLATNTNFFDNSVFSGGESFGEKLWAYYQKYNEYFQGLSPISSSIYAIGLVAFGYGLLKYKEWARKLGFVFVALSVWAFVCDFTITSNLSVTNTIDIMLSSYVLWTITSKEVVQNCQKNKTQSETDST